MIVSSRRGRKFNINGNLINGCFQDFILWIRLAKLVFFFVNSFDVVKIDTVCLAILSVFSKQIGRVYLFLDKYKKKNVEKGTGNYSRIFST